VRARPRASAPAVVAMITDVPGVRVGHATDPVALTGVSVVLCDTPAVAGVEMRGWANDVIGLDYLDPRHLVGVVDGVVLGGGSRFGGEAIWGVLRWLEQQGRGYAAGSARVPHVPGAFLFDLNVGDGRVRPTREMGFEAARGAADGPVAEGNVGAGAGASVGKIHGRPRAMRGGIGSASVTVDGAIVGALVAVNALGDVRDPDTGALVAGARDAPDGRRLVDSARALRSTGAPERFAAPAHTTIGVVATNARLGKAEAAKVASLGMLGFAAALSPPHTAFDGDTLFALSLGQVAADVTRLGLLAAEAVAQAIVRGVRAATSLPDLPAARDLFPRT
jgi:L-aminopeptidase/D-esterase-like protein